MAYLLCLGARTVQLFRLYRPGQAAAVGHRSTGLKPLECCYATNTSALKLWTDLLKRSRRRTKKKHSFAELIEVKATTTNDTKASVSKLKAAQVALISDRPEMCLSKLGNLMKSPEVPSGILKHEVKAQALEVSVVDDLNWATHDLEEVESELEMSMANDPATHGDHKFSDLEADSEEPALHHAQETVEGASQSTSVPTKSKNNPETKKSKAPVISKANREKLAKTKWEELERSAKEATLSKTLHSYLDLCIHNGQLQQGVHTFFHYRWLGKHTQEAPKIKDVDLFNLLMKGFVRKGQLMRQKEMLNIMRDDGVKPNLATYAAILMCLGKCPVLPANETYLQKIITDMEEDGYTKNCLFNKCKYEGNEKDLLLNALRRVDPAFVPDVTAPDSHYVCRLLHKLNDSSRIYNYSSPAHGVVTTEDLWKLATEQFHMEKQGYVTVESIVKVPETEHVNYLRTVLSETEGRWSNVVLEALEKDVSALRNQYANGRLKKVMTILPYMTALRPTEYKDIVMQEVRKLAQGSESYTMSTRNLYRMLGEQVMGRYQVKHKLELGIMQKLEKVYNEYCDWYLSSNADFQNQRQKWQDLIHKYQSGPDLDIAEKVWPANILEGIGKFLYKIIIHDIKINPELFKKHKRNNYEVPAFYKIYRTHGHKIREEIKPHPVLVRLYEEAAGKELVYESCLLPMVSPPLPWISIQTGGYLLSIAKLVRLPFQAHQQKQRLEAASPQELYPSLDSLNQLGSIPWRINEPILDLVIQVFNNNGDDSLGIPPPPSMCPQPPDMPSESADKQERYQAYRQRMLLRRKKAEMHSLWCDALYKLSLANHFRDKILWFPHNLDFRGRVYPCPPHLNHLGADVSRAILVFAKKEPLGPDGLKWLKIHIVNLTGLKKKESLSARLAYAEKLMPLILDSADNPLSGKMWWATSEEPWQTLACCMEIAKAVRSPDPEKYECSFPVHQDGSCNGLQHYAALGRDEAGAFSVNLMPADVPQDVYNSVAVLVERQRRKDAADGVKIAQILEGFVRRKVIKQTVMTTVYGVTRFGARLQIVRQLKDIPDFPKEYMWQGSMYLVAKTFDSLQEMFTTTKEIQDWFTECARVISQVCGQNVEWITPLGLPVVQPYHRPHKKVDQQELGSFKQLLVMDTYERPNVMKQKNAFPPNFIHSLDSTHMMLTSLFCQAAGITFVSVHDCYWTHPSTVDIMNKNCRAQFVSLHSEPILEDLSEYMVKKYGYIPRDLAFDGSSLDASKLRLNQILRQVPQKGYLDLSDVLDSVYFFS